MEIPLNSLTVEVLEEAAFILGLEPSDLATRIIEQEIMGRFSHPERGLTWLHSIFATMEFTSTADAEQIMDRIHEREKARGIDGETTRFMMHRNAEGLYSVDIEAMRKHIEKVKAEGARISQKAERLSQQRRDAEGPSI